MKLLRIPKLPKFKLSAPRKPAAPKKLQARMRAADAQLADYEDEEPQTKLTSAFIVVLILHVVAVGGIYAFNQIKASRRGSETLRASTAPTSTSTKEQPKKSSAVEQTRTVENPPAPAPAIQPQSLTAVAPVSKQRVYNVRPGDNLLTIAKTFGVTAAELKAANGLTSDTIHPGQVLNLPTGRSADTVASSPRSTAPVEQKPQVKIYTVKSGDRLVFIAKKFGVTQEDLVALNKIKDPSKLQIGQTLKVPVKKGN